MRAADQGDRKTTLIVASLATTVFLLATSISPAQERRDPRWSRLPDTDTEFVPRRYERLEDWERVRVRLRKQILWSAGLWPMPERSPLNVHSSGRIVHDDYTVEKVRFESFPGLWVCGNLYKPKSTRPRSHPGVLNPHGHAATGRLHDDAKSSNQARCITFARMGCVAFMWDMVDYNDSARQLTGKYERENYWSVHNEHWQHGKHARALWNVNAFGLQLWNGIRALDFLSSLPEVDSNRLAATGESGGGTQTFTLYAVDDRVKVAAPVCMVSAYMQGGCNCENAPGLRIDTNNVDFGAMMSPRPLLLVSVTKDWTRNTPKVEHPAIGRVYDLYDAGDRLRNVHLDARHGYNLAMREAVYPWFARWLGTPLGDDFKEPEYRPEKSEDLLSFATSVPAGAIRSHDELVARRIESTRRQLDGYKPTDVRSLEDSRDALGEGLRLSTGVSGLDAREIEYEREGPIELAGLRGEKGVLVDRGRGVRVPVRVFRPESAARTCSILVSGDGVASLARRADLLRALLDRGQTVFAVDVFGRGDSVGGTQAGKPRGTSRYFHTFNRSDDSERVYDIVVAIRYCSRQSHEEVHVLAFGDAGPWAAVAGATLEAPRPQGATIRFAIDANGFDTSSDDDYLRRLFIPGILRAGGLPVAAALVAPRPLVLHNTRGRFDRSWIDAAYSTTRPSSPEDGSVASVLVATELLSDADVIGHLASRRSASLRDRARSAVAGNAAVADVIDTFEARGAIKDDSEPSSPEDSIRLFDVDDELEIELVASEPGIRQPLYMSFDHRGRLWVVQYLQYPFPAGLRVIRYDQHLRAVFDRVPPPPPEHFRGADKISVLEDTNGDGQFDSLEDVITGLNIATAVVVGRGGIWVLNPPYLLFYPDADGDDVPDRDPVVRLRGFGIEDTHSVASSLRWGPDGWLYGVNGSTTTGTVSSEVTPPVRFEGQCVWRYHPDTKVFEIYAEGGGNTFSLDFDAAGRVFSGTNHGRTRGMHYAQGGYATKNWGKHGPLTNPFAFGFYEHMRHEGLNERFSQAVCIYEGGALPSRFDHAVIAANSLHRRVVASTLSRDSSTWRTKDMPTLVTTTDRWFRPVDIKVGPDGAVYLADWYDSRLSHADPRDNWHKASGRIYRLRAKGAATAAPKGALDGRGPFDLSKLSSERLVDVLVSSENKWFRHTSLRVLGERQDRSVNKRLREIVIAGSSARTLDALWALNLLGGFDGSVALATLASGSPDVRRWSVRLLGDTREGEVSSELAKALERLAETESDAEVRSQLASSAKRLPASQGLPIVRRLAARKVDLDDRHIPLLVWWAVEGKASTEPEAVLSMLEDDSVWSLPLVERFVLERLMQRFAMAGSADDLAACARLLELSPDDRFTRRLMSGLEAAFRGRQVGKLPDALSRALESYQRSLGASDLALALRQGKKEAVDRAIAIVQDASADKGTRLAYIEILGEIRQARCVDVLKRLLRTTGANSINRTALQALRNFDDPTIADSILGSYQSSLPSEHAVRSTAHRVLASRKEWTIRFLREIDKWRIKKAGVSLDVVHQMTLHDDPGIDALIEKHWGKIRGVTPQAKKDEIARIRRAILSSKSRGVPARGKEQFARLCAKCHTLFDEAGDDSARPRRRAGPELTGYERDNLDFLLPAIVDPSLAIREEFTNFLVVTKDARTLTGLIDKQDLRTVTLRDVDSQTTLVPREQILRLQALDTSLMPEGITHELSDSEIRDLFSYLTSRTPGSRGK